MESLTGVNQFLVANSEMDSGSHKSRWDMLERQGVGKLSKSTGKAGEAGLGKQAAVERNQVVRTQPRLLDTCCHTRECVPCILVPDSKPGGSLTRMGWFHSRDPHRGPCIHSYSAWNPQYLTYQRPAI